jgi:hypothetical protein
VHFGCVYYSQDVLSVPYVSGIQSHFGCPGFNRFNSAVRAEVNVGYKGDIHFLNNFCEGDGIGKSGDGDSDQLATGPYKLIYLPHTACDLDCRHLCHGLDYDRAARTESYRADFGGSCFSSLDHMNIVACLVPASKLKYPEAV